jgi:DNA invertase Pin-like site-specific DNA recombinase
MSVVEFPRRAHPPASVDAYLYNRVSSKIQLKGLGIERQETDLTKFLASEVARDEGLVLKGTFADLGISAFRGQNRHVGEFKAFLDKVRDPDGPVKPGSWLIVESLDRIGRDLEPSLAVILELRAAGIIIHTVIDRMTYRPGGDPRRVMMDLMISLTILMRAAEESDTKSERGLKNWGFKRRDAGKDGKLMTSAIPSWLTIGENHRPAKDPDRAKIVNHIFELCAAGHGAASILHRLNGEGHRAFGWSGQWTTEYIRRILVNRAVLGEAQPALCNYSTDKKPVPIGDPIIGYFPRVIEDDLWRRAETAITERKKKTPGVKVRLGQFTNLFGKLCRCVECGGPMVMVSHHRNKTRHYLRCKNRYVLHTCDGGLSYAYDPLERAVLGAMKHILADDKPASDDPSAKLETEIAAVAAECNRAETRKARLYSLHAKGDNDPTLLQLIEDEKVIIGDLTSKSDGLKHQRSMVATLNPARIGRDIAVALIAEAIDHGSDARATLAMELRSIIRVIAFFSNGSVIVRGAAHHILIERGEVMAIRADCEDIVHPAGSFGSKFVAKIERMAVLGGGKIDQAKIDRRLASAKSHRTR